jgi:hypothetical protein
VEKEARGENMEIGKNASTTTKAGEETRKISVERRRKIRGK